MNEAPYTLPEKIPVSSIFLDESGSKNSAGGFFVIGFIKSRDPSRLVRDVKHLRQKHGFYNEIKFSGIRTSTLPFHFDLAELIAGSGLRVGASVYDAKLSFRPDRPTWRTQADQSALLVRGNINKGELVNVFLDLVETPNGISLADLVKSNVNERHGGRSVLEAYDVDPRSNDAIQLADIVAGAISYERRVWIGEAADPPGSERSAKGQVMLRLRRALGLNSFNDIKSCGVNIMTFPQKRH